MNKSKLLQKKVKKEIIKKWFEQDVFFAPEKETLFSDCFDSYKNFTKSAEFLTESKKSFSIILREIISEKSLENKIQFKNGFKLIVRGIVVKNFN